MKNEIQDYLGRPKRYDNIDGSGEMAFGLMALGWTFLGYLQAVVPHDSMWRQGFASMGLFFAVVLLMCGLILGVSKEIKKHITWPRTGYVRYRTGETERKSLWTLMVAVALVSAGVAAGVACLNRFDRRHDWIDLAWMGNVALFVVGYACWVYRMEKHHPWKWLVLLGMVLGLLAIALIHPAEPAALWRPMLLFVGLMWLGSGVASLYSYIRHTQPPTPGAE